MYKIMIADDEGIVIDALKFIIEKSFGETCQVRSAKTGRSVIELAESFRPDIALMDIQMPGINGIEAMKEIRKTNKDIIFIVITAYDKFDYAREAVGLGVMEYVNKPIDRVKITRLLEQAMERINGERERRHRLWKAASFTPCCFGKITSGKFLSSKICWGLRRTAAS